MNITEKPDAGDFPDLMKLYRSKKAASQSMVAYLKDLNQQAAIIKNKCCQEEIIRSKLIQEIGDERVLQDLNHMTNPSAQIVAQFCDRKSYHVRELHRNALPHVIPYLTLDQIGLLTHSLPWTEERILEEIAGGRTITIDDHLLERLPPDTQPDLYAKFSNATSVIFRRVEEDHLQFLLSLYFQNVGRLNLLDLVIFKSISCFPRSLETLKVIRGMFEKALFEELIDSLPSLHHLHLDNTRLIFNVYENFGGLNLTLASNLKTVVIKSDKAESLYFGPQVLDSLILIGQRINLDPFPKTRSLYSDGFQYQYDMDRVNSATFEKWTEYNTNYKFPSSLEQLKIVQSIDPRFRADIEAITANVKSVDMHYYDYAPEDKQDLILNMLNDDCLELISDYLDPEDCRAFSQIHTRIWKLVRDLYRRKQRRVYKIGKDSIDTVMLALRGERGETLKHLVFKEHDEEQWHRHRDTWPIVAGLPNLSQLTFLQLYCGYNSSPIAISGLRHVFSRVGGKLSKLVIRYVDGQIGQVIQGGSLPKLEELYITTGYRFRDSDVRALCTLKELRVLGLVNFYNDQLLTDDIVMQLVHSLPHLVRIETDNFESTAEFAAKVDKYVKQQGRKPFSLGLASKLWYIY